MNIDAPALHARRIEVLANGLPLWQGAQAAVDTTLVSPVTRDGGASRRPRRGHGLRCGHPKKAGYTPGTGGSSPVQARRGGCGSGRAIWSGGGGFLARAREVPARLQSAARQASLHRWTGMLAIAAQRAFAHSLLELPPASVDANASSGTEPPLGDLLAEARGIQCVPNSRLPALMGPRG